MSTANDADAKAKVVIERTYRASVKDLWDLWTTKEGFESWWGPQSFRVEVHEIDARVGGALRYAMIADTPEMIAAMKAQGQPASHDTRGRFTEVRPHERIVITHVIDFVPGVPPFDNDVAVEFFASGDRVRMVITLEPFHDEQFSKMQAEGFTSQLTKLDARFA